MRCRGLKARLLFLAMAMTISWGCAVGAAQAEGFNFCDRQTQISATQQDKLFRFAGIIKAELAREAGSAALIARSGLDLQRFGIRYSHSGVVLRDSDNGPWSVRQLYYACDERKPRLYDQGISGFLLGTDKPDLGFISVLLLPQSRADSLAQAASDKRRALEVLGASYSANAYAFGTRYQNCNQWLIELLALAWSQSTTEHEAFSADARARAQAWLLAQSFEPSVIDVGAWWMVWAAPLIPFIHNDDHPPQDLQARRYRVSMPAAIESFVRQIEPQASRIEFCHTETEVVIHRGWDPIAPTCQPGEGDAVVRLD